MIVKLLLKVMRSFHINSNTHCFVTCKCTAETHIGETMSHLAILWRLAQLCICGIFLQLK